MNLLESEGKIDMDSLEYDEMHNKQTHELRLKALAYHEGPNGPGKFKVQPTKVMNDQKDLSLAYSPGVAEPCLEIEKDPEMAYKYTNKGNMVAVVSNGTAVLGLGDIGPLASKPVMEGKAVLFNKFAGINSIDLCLDATDPDDFIRIGQADSELALGARLHGLCGARMFGGVNQRIIRIPLALDHFRGIISGKDGGARHMIAMCMCEDDRLEIVSQIKGVDEAVMSIDDDKTVCKTLDLLKPDVFANGGDRSNSEIPEFKICKDNGTKVVDGLGEKI